VRGQWFFSATARSIGLALSLAVAGCAHPVVKAPGNPEIAPALNHDHFRTADNVALPYDAWIADDPKAIFLGLHGMNDYARAFAMAGPWFAARGYALFAFDQRGFGRTASAGYWPGDDALVNDAHEVVRELKGRYPDTPVYLLGASMGGAVALSLAAERETDVAGVILVAPAVWGWWVLEPLYSLTLRVAAHAFPGRTLTGEGLDILPSDNIELLRENYRDPHLIKATRTDAIYGLVVLMERAYNAAADLSVPTLLLDGARDRNIPHKPIMDVAERLRQVETIRYADGYHMLLRDLQAEAVWRDILDWVNGQPRFTTSKKPQSEGGPAGTGAD